MSSLLKLPAEIRQRIFQLVVGGQLIHVKHDDSLVHNNHPCDAGWPWKSHRFHHAVCVSHESNSDHDHSQHGYQDAAVAEYATHQSLSCDHLHSECRLRSMDNIFGMIEEERVRLRMDLSILLVCQQIHDEATFVLWNTNTFSFDEEVTFEKFVDGLSQTQKDTMANLHIQHGYGDSTTAWWKKVMRLSLITSLRGLRTFHLSLYEDMRPGSLQQHNREYSHYDFTEPILRLQLLPLKHVKVTISDSNNNRHSLGNNEWTVEMKRDIVEYVRNQLLHPTKAELMAAESRARQGDQEYNTAALRAACQEALKERARIV